MAEKNKKQKVNYSPEKKKKKKGPMIIAVCVFGAVLLISLPVVGKILSDSNNNLVIENESSAGWNQIDGEMIYIDPKTNQRAVGLYVIEGQSYLFDSDGGITPGWTTFEGNIVYVSKEGTLATGLYSIGSDVYYFDPDNFGMYTGFKSVDGNVYCFRDDGRAMKDFQSVEGNDYYFDSNGVMKTGWFLLDGKNYYASDDGQLAKGWKILDDGTHYFTEDFSAANGELLVDDTVYNFDQFGCPDNIAEVTTEAPVTTVAETTHEPVATIPNADTEETQPEKPAVP